MTGSTPEHSVLSSNIEFLLREQPGKSGPCRVHHDQYVAIPDNPPVVPDVVLTCDLSDWDKDKRSKPFKIRSPLTVVEVLTPSTQAYDREEKFARYILCSTFEVYILVSPHRRQVEVYRRANDWQQELFQEDQTLHLDQLDLELPLAEIHEGVL